MPTRQGPPQFRDLATRSRAQSTFCDAEAEIGEAVDFVVHVERQPASRILHEGLGLCEYDRDTKRFLIDPVFEERTCGSLEHTTTRISLRTFPVNSTWNPGDFRLDISAPMPCFPPV
jgi:hypothetical protein